MFTDRVRESSGDWNDNQGRTFTRPLCAYVRLAQYDGEGDRDDEAGFRCAVP